jgi:hypothetical protein
MKFSDKYISSICPELGKWEVQLLKNHLLDMHHPNDIYEQLVRTTSRGLFPELYRWRAFKNREAVFTAIELLKDAEAVLADITEMSDEVARTQQDIKSNIVYLFKEMGEK